MTEFVSRCARHSQLALHKAMVIITSFNAAYETFCCLRVPSRDRKLLSPVRPCKQLTPPLFCIDARLRRIGEDSEMILELLEALTARTCIT